MSFNYTPHTEKEIAEMDLLPEGDYAFEVLKASEAKSKAGSDMIALELLVFDEDGGQRKVKDYLVPGTPFGDKKLFGFCRATGLMELYTDRTLTAEAMVGKAAWAKIGVSKGKPKPDGGTYNDQNSVRWYRGSKPKGDVHSEIKEEPAHKGLADSLADQDVPF